MNLTRREVFNLARDTDVVINITSSAADNAADTVGFANRFDENKQFTDAFVDIWFDSLIGLLSERDGHTAEEAEWFRSIGVEA
jgi:hypothetical protein